MTRGHRSTLRTTTEADRLRFDIAVKEQCRELRGMANSSRRRLGLDLIPLHDASDEDQ